MRLLSRSVLPLVLLTALSGASAAAWAQSAAQEPPQQQREDATRPSKQHNRISLSDSVRRAQRETGGQVLGAERVQFDGREINRVKVMDDRGRVRYMDDDPQRGRGSSSNDRSNNDDPKRERGADDRGRGVDRLEYEPRARRDNRYKP